MFGRGFPSRFFFIIFYFGFPPINGVSKHVCRHRTGKTRFYRLSKLWRIGEECESLFLLVGLVKGHREEESE